MLSLNRRRPRLPLLTRAPSVRSLLSAPAMTGCEVQELSGDEGWAAWRDSLALWESDDPQAGIPTEAGPLDFEETQLLFTHH